MHDYDNNTKLDGLELLKSMTHHHDDEPNGKYAFFIISSFSLSLYAFFISVFCEFMFMCWAAETSRGIWWSIALPK